MATTDSVYVWEGTDRRGMKTRGEATAPNLAIARAQLLQQGIIAKKVRKKSKPLFTERKRAIKPLDIAIFTRQLATMTKAGVPLVQSFDIVADGHDNPSMQELVVGIKNDVAGGTSFANALERHPRYFDDLYCSLIRAGETSGALEIMMDRVATYKEKTEALKVKIRKALTYPLAVIAVAVVVTGILLVYVVPTFAETFQSFGSDLPTFTLWVIGLSELVQQRWFYIMIGAAALFVGIREARLRNKNFADKIDELTLRVPVIGNIVFMSIIARFSRTLATTFTAGVPLVEALTSVAGSTGNVVYENAVKQIRDDVTTGQALTSSIRTTGRFPAMLVQMVGIGEESGALDDMLEKVAEHYEMEVDAAVDNLTSLLEPMIMSFLGIIVGGLMVAMYLPIFTLGQAITG
jgi:type IV pilus assembly protein PilC